MSLSLDQLSVIANNGMRDFLSIAFKRTFKGFRIRSVETEDLNNHSTK